jgi:hypothetical protein
MAWTERLDPQLLHVTKLRRFSPLERLQSISSEFHLEDTRNVLCIWGTARLAGDVFDNVPPEHVLNLLLLEATLDDQPAVTSDGTAGTQLSEQELCDVLLGTLHALADLGNVGENGLLVAFT